jgi:hypothetical protein
MKRKRRRVYKPRIVGGKVMLPADLERLHKYMLDIEGIDHMSDEMRAVVESEWPELAHKLPPSKAAGLTMRPPRPAKAGRRDGRPGPATTRPGLWVRHD